MFYVPTPPPPSRKARELNRKLVEVIDAYKRANPGTRDADVHAALRLAETSRGGQKTALLGIVIGILVLLGGLLALFLVERGG